MTRFVGDAVGVKSASKSYTAKDRRAELNHFLEHGVHPSLQRSQAAASAPPPLPPRKSARPHAFLVFSIQQRQAGRIEVELFEDVAPAPVALFRERCSSRGGSSYSGSAVKSLVPGMAFFAGKAAGPTAGAVQVRRCPELRHVERGAVSVSFDGSEFGVALSAAPHLDATHQVIGRVTAAGMVVIDRIERVGGGPPDDAPLQRVTVTACGMADAEGSAAGEGEGPVTGDQAREAVKEALSTGLKRPLEAAPSGEKGAKRGVLDALLLGGDGEDDSSDSE